jgi:hypothetical protein
MSALAALYPPEIQLDKTVRVQHNGRVNGTLEKPGRMQLRLLRKAAARAPGRFPIERAHALAGVILGWYLGLEWIERALSERQSHPFLLRRAKTRDEVFIHFDRFINLAEMLFNLRDIEGIEAVIDQLRAGQIESAFAELEVGKVLATHDIKFRFIIPLGVKGNNYDVELVFPAGMRACSETKSKIGSRAFSAKGVAKKLSRAREQLPADRPGVIFLKVPQEWLQPDTHTRETYTDELHGDPNSIRDQLHKVARSFFRQTERIVLVEFYSNVLRVNASGDLIESVGGLETENPSHRFDRLKSWQLLTTRADRLRIQNAPTWWVSLWVLAGAELDRLPDVDRLVPKRRGTRIDRPTSA